MKITKLIEEINKAILESNLDKIESLFNELCEEIKLYPEQCKKIKRVFLYNETGRLKIGYIRLKNPKIILFSIVQDFFLTNNNSSMTMVYNTSIKYVYKSIDSLKLLPIRKKQYVLNEIKRIRYCIINRCEYEHDNTRDGRWLYLQYRLYKFLDKLPRTKKLMYIYTSKKLFRVIYRMKWSEKEHVCYKSRRVARHLFS